MTLSADYLSDAAEDFKTAKSYIKVDSSPREIVLAAVFSAVGTEKLLKGLLAKVNPAFILTKPDFDTIAGACHLDLVTDTERKGKATESAGADVVTLRNAIQRAGLFYVEVKQNAPILHALASFRDAILHRRISEVSAPELELLVKRDLFPTLRQMTSLDPSLQSVWADDEDRLARLSHDEASNAETIAAIERKLEQAAQLWAQRKVKPVLVTGAKRVTQKLLAADHDLTSCECPACGNEALVHLEIDYDYDYDPMEERAIAIPTGAYPDKLKCQFCSLELDTYEEFMYVNLDDRLASGPREID